MNTGSNAVMRLLGEQRRRCLATILTSAESSTWWARLSDEQQNTYRDQVKAALAVFYELTRDIVKVTEDDSVRNGLALELLQDIHARSNQIAQKLETIS